MLGQSQTYSVIVYSENGYNWTVSTSKNVVWSINSGSGTYVWTGNSVMINKTGTWTVTATYRGKSDNASLTVTHASGDKLDHITASVNPTTVAAPSTTVGNAIAYDIYGNSWNISILAVWSIPAGNDGGSWVQNVYTSHTAGNYTVQTTYEGKTATASLTVTHATNQAYLDHISISPKSTTVSAGTPQSYTATAYDVFGNSWTINPVYSCTNSSIVISGNSVYSNATGVYTITGTYNGKSDTATLTVSGHLVTIVSITVSPKTASISAGNSQFFTAAASDGYNIWDITDQVLWSINTTAGGSWNQTTGTYTSANAGNWQVTATLDTLSDTATLTVNANSALLDHISISPKTATVTTGTPRSFTVTAYDKYSNSLGDVTSSTAFSASGTSVTGNSIVANNAGFYTVTATYNGLTDTANLTVTGVTSYNSYTVTFSENGLQTGTSWNINFNGQDYSSTTSNITITNLSEQSYSWSTSNSIQNGQTRYVTAQTSGNLSVPNQLTQTLQYTTQFFVTYSATGNVLFFSVPADEWVNSGGQATGSFPAQVINVIQDIRCNLLSDNRPTTITQPTNIVASYQTQYYLTVSSAYGNPNGEGWYDSGSIATVSVSGAIVSNGTSVQFAFSKWSGDASGTALTSNLTMVSPKIAIAEWSTQYLVTYAAVGNAIPISVPSSEWVNSGAAAQGTFVSTVVNSANDIQCLFLSDNRTQSITEPTMITGKYQTQYKVTFNQTGMQSDAKGTIVTVSGIAEDFSQLAKVSWMNSGTQLTFSFEAKVATTSVNKVYSLTGVNASSPIMIDTPTLIQGNYKAQNSSSLYTILAFAAIFFVILVTIVQLLGYRRRRKKKLLSINETASPQLNKS